MPSGTGSNTTPTPSHGAERKQDSINSNNDAILTRQTSHDPTSYVQRARVTRAAPPKPATNPLQFIQIKPCNLYQSAQEQLKRAEDVKKSKEIKKEEPEDWQSNLDNWKSCRRKRVEHIIDRVVEVKKMELEDHDRARRKSKTFSEMLEERGTKGRKLSLAVYAEDDANDLSDLGIGTSSASGKSSLSEDFDNHSVISDNQDIEKLTSDVDNNSNHENGNSRDYISSPGYDTSSSTAPASSPDPCEYTYEGAIQDYKSRVCRAQQHGAGAGGLAPGFNGAGGLYPSASTSTASSISKDSTPERNVSGEYHLITAPKRPSATKIENRLLNFEIKGTSQEEKSESLAKKDLPKVDILKRRELFEKETSPLAMTTVSVSRLSSDFSKTKSIKERMSNLEKRDEIKDASVKKLNRMSNEFSGKAVKDRLTNIGKPIETEKTASVVIDAPIATLKDRLSSLQAATTQNLIDIDDSTEKIPDNSKINEKQEISINLKDVHNDHFIDTDREDSGIHTADVSCSVSQNDESIEDSLEPTIITSRKIDVAPDVIPIIQQAPVNAEPSVLTTAEVLATIDPNESIEQDTSVIEALELAFKAIDTETHAEVDDFTTATSKTTNNKPTEPIYENIDEITELYAEIEKDEQQQKQQSNGEPNNPNKEPSHIDEPYYQIPKSTPVEPYYQVPNKTKPVPLYENVEIMYNINNMKYPSQPIPIAVQSQLEPPKEKPPPPPVDVSTDEDDEAGGHHEAGMDDADDEEHINKDQEQQQDPMKRMNSTKRIKKEIRNKRTSFLGIEGNNQDDDSFLELSVAPPPDMVAFIQEERRLEKQMYIKAGLYDSSDTTDSRDSGVSENHSRQSSEPLTTSSEEHEDYIAKKEQEIIDVLEKEEERRRSTNGEAGEDCGDGPQKWDFNNDFRTENELISNRLNEEARMRNLEDQIREQEEVLRVERELLQLEQEELKRQRENLIVRENIARRDLDHGAKMLMSANRHSLQDVNAAAPNQNHYVNIVPRPMPHAPMYQKIPREYRQSMPNLLQDVSLQELNGKPRIPPPIPPAKPLRSHLSQEVLANRHNRMASANNQAPINGDSQMVVAHSRNHSAPIKQAHSIDDFVQLRNGPAATNGSAYGNMTKHTLHALSAVPKPKFQDGWVQNKFDVAQRRKSDYVNTENFLRSHQNNNQRVSDVWLAQQQQQQQQQQQKRRSDPATFNYNKHWLIQEAEQRRIEQERGIRSNGSWSNTNVIQRRGSNDNKPLPDAIIQTLTQRVQSRGLGERKKYESHKSVQISEPVTVVIPPPPQLPPTHAHGGLVITETHKEVLSVSGKKKCSSCGDELGRGAAMIIESLRLFYHLDCFKCCVCRVQLGDGVSGADVRVRNQKLHCHNCFSSDDGIKFSCV